MEGYPNEFYKLEKRFSFTDYIHIPGATTAPLDIMRTTFEKTNPKYLREKS